MEWTKGSKICTSFIQRIDAEARVLKLEKEVRDAKTVLKQLKQLPLRSVGDIKRVMSCVKSFYFNCIYT